ncbi:MAG: DUF805 domain-containing protein [Allosphingosinicella sp.]
MSAKIGLWEHFRKLASFKGREDRGSFWPYAALAFGIVMVASSLMTLPMMAHLMQAAPEFAAEPPDPFMVDSNFGDFSISSQGGVPQPMPTGYLAAYFAVTLGLAILLYAAATARRLHDRGKSGAWGLMPLPFIVFSTIQSLRMFGWMERGGEPDLPTIISLFLSSILFWVALGALVVLLAGPSESGADPRSGDD